MESYRHLVRYLKARLPDHRVSVRRVPMAKTIEHNIEYSDYGDTGESRGTFLIRINRELNEDAAKLAVVHEFGHVLSWHTDKHPSDHGPEFGKAYARVWRLYLDWLAS